MDVRRSIAILAALAALLGGERAEAAPVLPLLVGEVAADSSLLPCDGSPAPAVLTGNTHLDPSCTYRRGIEIVASGVTLDCRGATIEDPGSDGRRGILVAAAAGVALENVVVRNCIVRGHLNGIRVTREGFKELAAGQEYETPTRGIVIENSRIFDTRGSGVFIDGYVTDVTLRDLEIARSGSVGVYLEAGSKENLVEGCDIHENGFGDVVPEGVPFVLAGTEFRYESTGREGIAIDGSRHNVVRGNRIAGNAAGGIFLYKNCGEYVTEKPRSWWTRRYGADGNAISRNTLSDGPTGIWIGSRMGENQLFLDCSDPAYATGPLLRAHEDFARSNLLRGNTLTNFQHAIRIEDDESIVSRNRIRGTDAGQSAIVVGTKRRTEILGRPVRGTVLVANRARIPGNDHPYLWAYGHEGTVERRNRSFGQVVGLAPGSPPASNQFLFVKRFWVP